MCIDTHIAVVWSFVGRTEPRLWEGVVIADRTDHGRRLARAYIRYDQCPQRALPFPPTDERVRIHAVRVRQLPQPTRKGLNHEALRQRRRGARTNGQALAKPDSPAHIVNEAKNGLRLATLNVSSLLLHGEPSSTSLRRCIRLQEILHHMQRYDLHVICLQEVRANLTTRNAGGERIPDEEIRSIALSLGKDSYVVHLLGAVSGYGGLAMVTRNFDLHVEKIHPRIMTGRATLDRLRMRLVNVYAPTSTAARREHETFHACLEQHWAACTEEVKLMLGDLNAPLTTRAQRGPQYPARGPATDRLNTLLAALSAQSAHVLCPARQPHTFVFPNGAAKQLDHICICKRFASALHDHRVLLAPYPTSHRLVQCALRVKWKCAISRRATANWWQLRRLPMQQYFADAVTRELSANAAPNSWESLHAAACRVATTLPSHQQQATRHLPTEDTTAVLRSLFHRSRARNEFETLDSAERQQVEVAITEECRQLEADLKQRPRAAFRNLSCLLGHRRVSFNPPGLTTSDKLRNVREFFRSMGGDTGGCADVSFPVVATAQMDDAPFTVQELRAAARRLPFARASGPDGLPAEALRAMAESDPLASTLLHVINDVWTTGKLPLSWATIDQVPIPKKGDLGKLENWRPICLVPCITKLMNRMILSRIQPAIEPYLRDSQFGFRPFRTTNGAQLILREILGKTGAHQGLAVCFVDFAKAFPSISFAAIRAALEAFRVPHHLRQMILALYDSAQAKVRTPLGDTEPFPICTGTMQGDVLAPFLFILVLDRVLHLALDCHNDGILVTRAGSRVRGTLRELRITDLNYADDLVLFSDSTDGLCRMLQRVVYEAAKVNLKLNIGPTKTAWMALGRLASCPQELNIPGLSQPIPRVHEYKYLGVPLHTATRPEPLVDRVRLAWGATHRLMAIWQLPLDVSVKRRLFDTLVHPILTYGLGTYHVSAGTLHWVDVQVSHMRRVALRLGRFDEYGFPRHHRELYGATPTISEAYRLATAQLFGHVLRHGHVLEMAVLWQSTTKRGQRSWPRAPSDVVARLLGYASGQDLLDVARDRDAWHRELKRLAQDLSTPRTFVPVTDRHSWSAARRRARTYEDFQYIEEGYAPFPFLGDELHIYTDGSLISSKVPNGTFVRGAGVGLFLCGNLPPSREQAWSLTAEADITIDRAELLAAIHAMRAALAMDRDLVLHTDSEYVWSFLHYTRRIHRASGFSDLKNSDLLRTLDGLDRTLRHVHGRRVYVVKVRAHNGHPHNDRADQLAVYGATLSAKSRGGSNASLPTHQRRSSAPNAAVRAALRFYCPRCPNRRYKRLQDLKGHLTRYHSAESVSLLARILPTSASCTILLPSDPDLYAPTDALTDDEAVGDEPEDNDDEDYAD